MMPHVVVSLDSFQYSESFLVPYEFGDCICFCEKCHWNFIRDCIKSIGDSGQYGHFKTVLTLPIHEHVMYFCLFVSFPFFFFFLQASLVAWTVKCLPTMQETQVQSLGREDPLEKEMATHSSIYAWKIPWIEEPGGLQSMGSQRVGHD